MIRLSIDSDKLNEKFLIKSKNYNESKTISLDKLKYIFKY